MEKTRAKNKNNLIIIWGDGRGGVLVNGCFFREKESFLPPLLNNENRLFLGLEESSPLIPWLVKVFEEVRLGTMVVRKKQEQSYQYLQWPP